ncbi:MAG TPA: trypsin-like peptidase domain-containing protein [Planctomycetota bacterium]
MRAQLLHLSGADRGRTLTYEARVVRIGAAPGCEAVIRSPGVADRHAQIEFVQEECKFHLRRLDGQVFVNGAEVEEVILQDGDRIEFGPGGPMARFRIYVPLGAVCKPVHRMLADARDVGRVSGGAAATKTFTRDLLTQATRRLKITVPLTLVGAALLGWLAGWFGGRLGHPAKADLVTRAELESLRKEQQANAVSHAELDALRAEQKKQQEELATLARANSVVLRIQKEWSRGVCLMHGVYRLRMPDQGWFSLDGSEPFEVEYTGSGFLASKEGHIITNRHVAAPWTEERRLTALIEQGVQPEFLLLTATFPGRAPVDVPQASIKRRADERDVALVQVDPKKIEGVPVLPLQLEPVESEDQRAIVVGYPLGLGALLARANDQLVDDLRQRSATMSEAIAALAAAGQINPILTQGGISEEREEMIVYDAATTHGGSGGPVFGGSGLVIAVNFAIQPGFTGVNYGVPIRFARELLPR